MLIINPLKYTKKEVAENKFKEGDVVYTKENPDKKLVVKRFIDKIYFCQDQKEPGAKELVYFERELADNIQGEIH